MAVIAVLVAVLSVKPYTFAELPTDEDQRNSSEGVPPTQEVSRDSAESTLSLEDLEKYAEDIVSTDEGEKDRIFGHYTKGATIHTVSCGKEYAEAFGVPHCIKSLTENGELARQHVEAKLFLKHAQWRVAGGKRVLEEAEAKLYPGDVEYLKQQEDQGWPISHLTYELQKRVDRAQVAINNATERYNRAVAARDKIEHRVNVLRQLLVNNDVIERGQRYFGPVGSLMRLGERWKPYYVTEGMDYRQARQPLPEE